MFYFHCSFETVTGTKQLAVKSDETECVSGDDFTFMV